MAISRLRQQNIFDNYGRNMSYDMNNSNFMGIPDLGQIDPLSLGLGSRPTMPGSQEMQPTPEEGQNPLLKDYRSWDFPPAEPEESEFDQQMRQLKQLYTPETYATKRFDDLLGQYPQREEPGTGRKIAASLAGLGNIRMRQQGGPEEAEKVMYAPHARNVADWKMKAEPYYQAANLERQANATERQLATSYLQSEAAAKRVKQSEHAANLRADVEREKITSREKIADDRIKLERMWRTGWKFNFDGAEVFAYKEGQTGPDGKPVFQNTGVKTGNVSEADKLIFGARLQDYLQQNREQAAIDLKKTEPGRAETPRDVNLERNNRFQEISIARPELRKFLVPPSTGNPNWNISAPPKAGWFSDVDPKEMADYNELRGLIGLPPIGNAQPAPAPTPKTEEKPAPPPPPPAPKPSARSSQGLGPVNIPVPPAIKETGKNIAQVGKTVGSAVGKVGTDVAGAVGKAGKDVWSGLGLPDVSTMIPKKAPAQGTPQQGGTLKVRDPKTGKTGTIPNTQAAIEAAVKAGLRVEVGQ